MARQFNLNRVLEPVKDIVRKLTDHRSRLMEDVAIIDDQLSRLGGGKRRGRKASANGDGIGIEPAGTKRKGKRTRRSREELATMAGDVVALIKGAGKEGARAKQLKAKCANI